MTTGTSVRRDRRRRLLVLAVVLLALGACRSDPSTVEAGDVSTTTTTSAPPETASTTAAPPVSTTTVPKKATPMTTTAPPATAGSLVLQVHTGGGFVPPGYLFAEQPSFSLYAGGEVVVPGPTTMEYPGRALPNLLTGDLGTAGVRDAVAAARAAGVQQATGVDLGQPHVADFPTTSVVLVDEGRTYRVEAYALGFDASTLTAAQQDYRRRLSDLVAHLEKLGAGAGRPYRAEAVSVLVQPYENPGSPQDPAPGEAHWPLGNLATGGVDQFGGRCLGFTGADAQRVLAAAGDARSNTRWLSGGSAWSLMFRPELPGATTCHT
ncbi:MAG TPA: hypothetical protein VFJ85_16295 [Acidimicrobiales bacterium]|nr:hypothetical protein [Acidimicrobiales bacterium]